MPNCNCCEHHLDGMDLQNQLCSDCQAKRIAIIIDEHLRYSEMYEKSAVLYKKEQRILADTRKYLEQVKQWLEDIKNNLDKIEEYTAIAEASLRRIDGEWPHIRKLRDAVNKLYKDTPLAVVLSDATGRSGGDHTLDNGHTKGDNGLELA